MNPGELTVDISPIERTAIIAEAYRVILTALGQDATSEGLRDTPMRAARALVAMTTPEPFACTTFKNEGTDEMIVQTGIPFHSLCEHHLLPFFGDAAVAYVPSEQIVGLSKLARAVKHYAAGLQNQERITEQIAAFLQEQLQPKGIAVLLRARHLCMETRGVRTIGTYTTTSHLSGVFRSSGDARIEFLKLATAPSL